MRPRPPSPCTSARKRILHGYLTLLAQLATDHGLPLAFYGDRLTVFVRNDSHWSLEEQLQGAQHPTQFGRILRELGIGYIAAGSPQAKGRIEKLWGTLQDRLVVELRLRGLATREAANAFLPTFVADYARRFGRAPATAAPAWRRPPANLADVLNCQHVRTVARDNTLRLGPRWLQIPPGPAGRSYAGCRVEVRECLDGRLLVFYQAQLIARAPSPGPDFVLRPRYDPRAPQGQRRDVSRRRSHSGDRSVATLPTLPSAPPRRRRASRVPPAPNHPWRESFDPRRRAPQGMTLSRGS